MTTTPLSDLRILDLTSGVAGPWCTKLLADYGADVIKIERPRLGDPTRGHGVFPNGVPHRERSALFLWLNTSKRSITLDIGCRSGRDLVLQLASISDAVVLDQTTEELRQLGLTPEEFHQVNERLAITSVTPFGLSGPYAEWSANNLIAFAAGGQHYLSGDPEREPLQTGGFQAQYQAGTWAFGATLAALHDARSSGRGQLAEVAGMEVMASILELYLPDYAYRHSDVLTTRRGNIASATVGIYPAEDGHIGIHVMPKNWPQLLEAMDARWMDNDERFADNRARLKNDGELSAEMYAWTTSLTKQEAYKRGGRSRAPISPVNTVADLLASPHLAAREFFREIEHPETGTMRYVGSPARMPASPAAPRRAPLLGEHNIEVYEGLLGLPRRDLVRLSSAGVI
jgi:crotonobetainyl-CoA:carnitine CoA-transferase CaiB-like acyl-CoA transferase